MKSLYVGKVPHQATEDDLQEWFGQAGFRVTKVTLIRDLFSRESRGFGFVGVTNHEEAERAVRSLDGKIFLGRRLVINEARPLPEGRGRSGSHGGRLGMEEMIQLTIIAGEV